jgi:hypothetical protein
MPKNMATGSDSYNFKEFAKMANDPLLSPNQKIGFPDSYREGYEETIFSDILSKVKNLGAENQIVLDIGPGCAGLPRLLIELCRNKRHELILLDSQEMLNLLPEGAGITKIAGFYPACVESLSPWHGKTDAIICYSVLHYIFKEASFWKFIDVSLGMLAPGGQLLLGDIPNVSKRKRFFASDAGTRFHHEFMKTTDKPVVHFNRIEDDMIDDAVVMAILQRARGQGFDAYVLPQPPCLPMANRREDILITRP